MEKFIEFPFIMKIVILWVYAISVLSFLRSFVALIQLSLDVFALAYGYLIWELAGGLVERSKLARVIALVWLAWNAVFRIYLVRSGGTVVVEDFKLSATNPISILWAILSISSVLILLLPQVRKLFKNPIQEEVIQ